MKIMKFAQCGGKKGKNTVASLQSGVIPDRECYKYASFFKTVVQITSK